MEEENSAINQEVATPEIQEQKSVTDLSYQERNWNAARQRITDLQRENQEKQELIKSLLEQKKTQVEEEPDLPDDEYVNHGKVKKLAKKAIEPIMHELEELKQQLAYQKQQNLFSSIKSKYSDFDDVVNPETIAIFEQREPELAAQIAELKDPYKIGVQSYKFIKASGILDEVPQKRRQKETEKMLEKNAKTMQSPQAYDKRPMAQAFRMTEAEKSALYDEMMGFASMAHSVPELS